MPPVKSHVLLLVSTCALLAQSPRIDSVSPGQVPIGGGTEVSVRGANLDGASISLDGAPITPTRVSAGEVRFIAPRHDNGFAALTAQRGANVAYGEFLYLPPPLRDLPPGAITTVAGIGSYFGNGRPATTAILGATNFVADAAGNIYVEEPEYNWVRRIRPDGIIEPFIGTGADGAAGDGGPALKAQLRFPRGIALDAAGNIYVTDSSQRVRRVDANTGTIMTIAGTGIRGFSGDGGPALRAQFDEPAQIAIDAQNNIYVQDSNNYRIRKITPDGIIQTVAGTGVPGFSGDGGPALKAQFDTRTGGDFGGLAVDRTGNIYLADTGNDRVRKIDAASGVINTIARADGVTTVYLDAQGNVWFAADQICAGPPPYKVGPRIVETSPSGDVLDSISELWGFSPDGTEARKAAFSFIYRLGQDRDGNLLVAENWTMIRRINRSTGILETIAGTGFAIPGENGPAIAALMEGRNEEGDLQVLPSQDLLVADAGRLRKLDRAGNFTTIGGVGNGIWPFFDKLPATQVSFGGATAAKPDAAGNIWVTSCCLSALLQIDKAGLAYRRSGGSFVFAGDGGPISRASLDQPWDVIVDNAGNLLIADSNNNRVRKVDAATGIVTTIAGTGPANGWERYGNGTTCGDGGPATAACINTPYGLALDRDGVLYISDNNQIRRVDRNGIISTFARLFATKMALDGAGNLYTVVNRDSVVRIRPDGAVTLIAGGNGEGFGGDGGPALAAHISSMGQSVGITIDGEGNLYFVDRANRRIRAIRYGAILVPPGSRAQTTSGTPQSAAIGMAFPNALSVYISDSSGYPAGNVRIDFDAPASGASCTFANGQRHISVLTDRNGSASAPCTANTSIGAFTVAAVPLGTTISLKFALTNTAPALASNSIVNAASFLSGAIAPGEIVTIFGAGVGPQRLAQAAPGPDGRYANLFAAVRVRFNAVEAPVLFARFDQAGIIVPYALEGASSAQVSVEYAGVVSNTIIVPVASSAPAVFTADASGRGQGAILNQDNSPNSAANPADRGSVIVLFCTGEGQTDPPGVDGKLANDVYPKPRLPVTVTIGGQPAEVLYYGAAPTLVAGVLQVNARVPEAVAAGSSVPLVLKVGGAASQPSITVAIR